MITLTVTQALLAGAYFGGVTFGLLLAGFASQSGRTIPYRLLLIAILLWPVALPVKVLYPSRAKRRFRA